MDSPLLIRPPLLNQASESGSSSGGGNSVTRRTFIKRTGGATVATLVAWNLQVAKANAERESSGNSSASFMCAISPVHLDASPGNVVGYCSFPRGGYIFLYHKDDDCCAEQSKNHHATRIFSTSQIYANAMVPAKLTTTPWVLHPDAAPHKPNEINQFDLGGQWNYQNK